MKKQYEILVNTPEAHKKIKGFIDDKNPSRKMMLDRYGRMVLHDSGVARDIEERFGKKSAGGTGEVTVIEVDKPKESGHRYSFLMPEMPWREHARKKREAAESHGRRILEETEGPPAQEVPFDVDDTATSLHEVEWKEEEEE